jgi:signal transduction histidine kinase
MVGQLLDNAVKFTQNGKVEFVAERQIDELADELVIHIIDSGIGIAQDQLAHLFEKFSVVDDSSTSKYGGTGLGLALSQKFCKLMGGEISVESELKKGSRFTIRMPLPTDRRNENDYGSTTLVPTISDLALQSTVDAGHA